MEMLCALFKTSSKSITSHINQRGISHGDFRWRAFPDSRLFLVSSPCMAFSRAFKVNSFPWRSWDGPKYRIGIDRAYINNSRHLARKYARIFVLGHYPFLVAHSFPRASLSENCSFLGTDNVRGQISEHVFASNGDYCLYKLGYLSLDIICSSKLTIFLELRFRKASRNK